MTREGRTDDGGHRDRGTGGTAPVARAPPAGLTVEAVTAVSVTVSWSPATPDAGVDHYAVSVDGTKRAESGRATGRAAVANLAPATTYTVAVRAVDETGAASPPATVEATTAAVDGSSEGSRSRAVRPDPTDATDEYS